MNQTDRLAGISSFVHTAETGSFSAAAARLNLSRSAVAKSVARLETRLGVRLIQRTTRSQSLTQEGAAFYARCIRILEELGHAEEEIQQGPGEQAVGKVRVSMPVQMGRRCIAPLLLELCASQPRLRLELSFSDRQVDLFEEGYDIAIRSGALPDTPNLRARPLGVESMVLCAAPAWIALHGEPATIQALQGMPAIAYGRAAGNCTWRFTDHTGQPVTAKLQVRIGCDDLDVMLQAALRGLGVVRLPSWIAMPSLREGSLVRLLPDLEGQDIPVHAVWPQDRAVPARLRMVIDILAGELPARLAAINALN